MYGMCRVDQAKDIGPHFEDEHGEPDTLPVQFRDPVTGYCQPYPHLGKPLTKQTAWVPTYVLRFRKTIPSDNGDVSKALHAMSDLEIVTLLHDGPFKSAQNEWTRAKRTKDEIKEMQDNARRHSRADRVSVCSSCWAV